MILEISEDEKNWMKNNSKYSIKITFKINGKEIELNNDYLNFIEPYFNFYIMEEKNKQIELIKTILEKLVHQYDLEKNLSINNNLDQVKNIKRKL